MAFHYHRDETIHVCLNCPLPDCVTDRHKACPLYKPRYSSKRWTPEYRAQMAVRAAMKARAR